MIRLVTNNRVRILLVLTSIMFCNVSFVKAQRSRTTSPTFYGVAGYMGKFNVYDKTLSRYNGTHPYGVELEFGKLMLGKETREEFGTFVKYGFGLNYVDFDHKDLGFGLAGIGYFEPYLVMRKRFRASLKMGAGLAYMSNPYDEESNPDNLAYSTSISMPLFGGVSMYYFISNHFAVKATGSIQHISNGGFKHPNIGINYPTFSFGFEYIGRDYTIPPRAMLLPYEKHNNLCVFAGYSMKKDSLTSNNLNVVTIIAQQSWQVSRVNALTVGVLGEFQQMEEYNKGSDQWSLAPMVGNEFIFGKILFGQQLGVYIIEGATAINTVMQNYYLRYRFSRHIVSGVDLKTHGRRADYLSVQVGYCF